MNTKPNEGDFANGYKNNPQILSRELVGLMKSSSSFINWSEDTLINFAVPKIGMIFVGLIDMVPTYLSFLDDDSQLITLNGDFYLSLLHNIV